MDSLNYETWIERSKELFLDFFSLYKKEFYNVNTEIVKLDNLISKNIYLNQHIESYSKIDLDFFYKNKQSLIIRNNRKKYSEIEFRWREVKELLDLFFDIYSKIELKKILDIGCGYGDVCFILNKMGFLCHGTLTKYLNDDFLLINKIVNNHIINFDLLLDNFDFINEYDLILCNKVLTLKTFKGTIKHIIEKILEKSPYLILGVHSKMFNFHNIDIDFFINNFNVKKIINDKILLERFV